jgi:hypothetical protein
MSEHKWKEGDYAYYDNPAFGVGTVQITKRVTIDPPHLLDDRYYISGDQCECRLVWRVSGFGEVREGADPQAPWVLSYTWMSPIGEVDDVQTG